MSAEMTREQACDTLRNTAWLGTNEDRERIERAVELLCGELCEDAISRQAAEWCIRTYLSAPAKLWEEFQKLPSVTPKQGPCVWCANIKKLNYRIEYYWVDWVGLPASLDPKCDHFVRKEIARFCPNCGRQLESEGDNDKSRD